MPDADRMPSILRSVEQDHSTQQSTTGLMDRLTHQSKRQRTDFDDHVLTDSTPRSAAARFVMPTAPGGSVHDMRAARPSFMRASVPTQEPDEPLPEVFSPLKRGQRFVPGGMAAELQTWVFETGNEAIHSRRGEDHLGGQNYAMTVKITQAEGIKPITIIGLTSDETEVRLLLVEGQPSREPRKESMKVGSTVGVKAPAWTVVIDSQDWIVGVDWKVLQ